MQLASEEITITISGEVFRLRPSLRAALRLVRKYETFAKIADGIMEGRLSVITDVIEEGSGNPDTANALNFCIGRDPLAEFLEIQRPLLRFVMALAGVDRDNRENLPDGVKPITFVEYFENLFSIATGMMGWPVDEAWRATPAEIIAAHKGRIDLLKMIFGSGDSDKSKALSLDQKALLAFKSIGIRKGSSNVS
ncbi:hypothetical protein AAFN47_01915 [Hoeflea sp. CAU 1731]